MKFKDGISVWSSNLIMSGTLCFFWGRQCSDPQDSSKRVQKFLKQKLYILKYFQEKALESDN